MGELQMHGRPTGFYAYKARCTGVYDGDTVTLYVDLGFEIGRTLKCRLYGIDTPELRGEERPFGLEVKKYVKDRVYQKELLIRTYRDKTGKYGRYLAEIFYEVDGSWINLNRELLEEGLAEPYML
jgi:micrococcal nuclease